MAGAQPPARRKSSIKIEDAQLTDLDYVRSTLVEWLAFMLDEPLPDVRRASRVRAEGSRAQLFCLFAASAGSRPRWLTSMNISIHKGFGEFHYLEQSLILPTFSQILQRQICWGD